MSRLVIDPRDAASKNAAAAAPGTPGASAQREACAGARRVDIRLAAAHAGDNAVLDHPAGAAADGPTTMGLGCSLAGGRAYSAGSRSGSAAPAVILRARTAPRLHESSGSSGDNALVAHRAG